MTFLFLVTLNPYGAGVIITSGNQLVLHGTGSQSAKLNRSGTGVGVGFGPHTAHVPTAHVPKASVQK